MFGYFQHDLCKNLEHIDFFRFSRDFFQIIRANIPTIETLTFIDPPPRQPAVSPEESEEKRELREAMLEATGTGRPVLCNTTLLLPFPVQDTTVIAKARGLDEYLVRKVGTDWLDGLLSLLLREFLLMKRACVDPLTGLLSSLHLEEYLDAELSQEQGVLVLVTVYPKGSSSFQAKKYQHRTVSLLKSYVNDRFPLYYLGQSCFAILCEKRAPDFAAEFAPLLVNYLKRERCFRVHVSTVSFAEQESSVENSPPISESLMKKAWAALHVASKRGPFAFCNYSAIENVDAHPLAPPSPPLKRWLQKVARKCNSFSLLQFSDGGREMAESIDEQTGESGVFTGDGQAHFLFLPYTDRKKLKSRAQGIIRACSEKSSGRVVANVGISIYSAQGRPKSEQLLNCRKALCHSAFLKQGSIVICDAVSFNISGDIYYGDGDLVRAVGEYKRGLQLAPENGNLLNSLGVCYAQMNKHRAASQCFQRACESEEDRFMALYNLGIEQQIQEENLEAIESFSRGLDCLQAEDQEKARKDISFQLAVLCTHEQQYERALELLQPWFASEKETGGGDKALKYLGEIYGGLGQNRKAMKYLQRAMRYDEYDAEVLGLLGEIYLEENEGDDIALRFCEKSVELSPDSPGLRIRLAKAQIQCGDLENAGKTLQPCLRNRKTRLAALEQRANLAREKGQTRAAEKWRGKTEKYAAEHKERVKHGRN